MNDIKLNNISNTNFKYTKNLFRKEWTKQLLYPNSVKLFNLITRIKWDTYKYEGDAFIEITNKRL